MWIIKMEKIMEKIDGWICQRCNEKISNETHIITHIEDKSH